MVKRTGLAMQTNSHIQLTAPSASATSTSTARSTPTASPLSAPNTSVSNPKPKGRAKGRPKQRSRKQSAGSKSRHKTKGVSSAASPLASPVATPVAAPVAAPVAPPVHAQVAATMAAPVQAVKQALPKQAASMPAPVLNTQGFMHKPTTTQIPTQIIMQPAAPHHFYENMAFVPNPNFVHNPNFGVSTYANGAQALISLYHSQVAGQKRDAVDEQVSSKRIKLEPSASTASRSTSRETTKAGRVRKQHNWSHDDIMELIYIWGEVQLEPSDGSFKWQCIHERYKQKHEWASLSCIRSYFKAKVKSVYNCKKVYDHVITFKQFPKPTDTWIYITRKPRGKNV